ncbi:MAG: acetyl-CoA decarbonylase/synthase complex subunit gamma [Candidatus Omnitrophota bacterium]
MALSGLDIYKLLPKTNCRECGFPTCLAFSMQLAKKTIALDKCPYLTPQAKQILEASSLPPIKLITVGSGENALSVGNETVMFRHEEKFYHPTGIGFILDDNDLNIGEKIQKINKIKFQRIGQELRPDLVALRQVQNKEKFIEALKIILNISELNLVLISSDVTALKEALMLCVSKKPLIYAATKTNYVDLAKLALEFKVPLAVSAENLNDLAELASLINKLGMNDLVLDLDQKILSEKIFNLTQTRRQALKKNNRLFGYPTINIVEGSNSYENLMTASSLICKYSSIVLLKEIQPEYVLSLLTLRQNIFTDPQKPLQIEPNVYSIGQTTKDSPVLITTNFSLSYYTVLGEVEASKIPSYLISVDTEGMSVLTAWAAEKFTPEKISKSLEKFALRDKVKHNQLIIPGYVAIMSGDLEESSGWKVVVGPREAAGIPSFLKNL